MIDFIFRFFPLLALFNSFGLFSILIIGVLILIVGAKLLETKIWIGASAGSIVLCPTVYNSCQELFDERFKDDSTLSDECGDIRLLKYNFGIVFQNLLLLIVI